VRSADHDRVQLAENVPMSNLQLVPRVATVEAFDLAEGPIWDAAGDRLLWVDINAGLVLAGTLTAAGMIEVRERVELGETVGAVAPGPDGSWLVAGAERLHVRSREGHVTPGPRVLPPDSGRRLNDGKPEPGGRYVVGSLSLTGASTTEELVVVDGAGVHRIDTDLTLSNGLAWSADGRTMFSVDTLRRVVYRRGWDPATGSAGQRDVFVRLAAGSPDGICLDESEHLWVAIWGLGQVHRYAPDGTLAGVVEIPAPHTSSVAFAGPALETLVITTARSDLAPDELAQYPGSGHLFTLEPGVRGLPVARWAGPVPGSS